MKIITFREKTNYVKCLFIFVASNVFFVQGTELNCRDRSSHLRLDGGLCFEIPPWQHQPVELEEHYSRLRQIYNNDSDILRRKGVLQQEGRLQHHGQYSVGNSQVSRYMDTVIAPFLDTYHRNIQSAYQQLSSKMLNRSKGELRDALQLRHKIYSELTVLADKLNISELCSEERRRIRTHASGHVALIYSCLEGARLSINKMGNYAEEMIGITKQHMQATLLKTSSLYDAIKHESEVSSCINALSRSAVVLGYELDLSLTNARRHNDQTCERFTSCSRHARLATDQVTNELREQLYQCVYA